MNIANKAASRFASLHAAHWETQEKHEVVSKILEEAQQEKRLLEERIKALGKNTMI